MGSKEQPLTGFNADRLHTSSSVRSTGHAAQCLSWTQARLLARCKVWHLSCVQDTFRACRHWTSHMRSSCGTRGRPS